MKKYILLSIIIILLSGCNNSRIDEPKQEKNISTKHQENIKVPENKTKPIEQINNETFEATLNIPAENKELKKYLPILMFHYIKDVPSDSPDQLGYKLSFSPDKLEQFLVFFKENNIETLTFWDLKDIIENKKPFPKKAIILTFDDGYIDHYQNAFRILKKHNMKGVFFIVSNMADNDPNYATWEQIKEMSENGQEIASHTVSHLDLATLSDEKIKYELETSKKTIEDKIDKPVISLCYPAGKYNDRVIKVAKENYLFARTTEPGKYFSLSERYQIPTVRMFPTTGLASLKIWFDVSEN
ncbi:MAG: polysaccharide deacetylase family protein [Candidatus Moranbacteria bacterium]|nr:polysaccharide deacetylase family protein [Candidatus Moranbacteria bacterium]